MTEGFALALVITVLDMENRRASARCGNRTSALLLTDCLYENRLHEGFFNVPREEAVLSQGARRFRHLFEREQRKSCGRRHGRDLFLGLDRWPDR